MTCDSVALVGAEYEENLSLRYLAASLRTSGFAPTIVPFDDVRALEAVVDAVVTLAPMVVGISIPFQVRAREFLELAAKLRERGYRGHICLGGHFATFEYERLLTENPSIDSVVRHEGEDTLRELCEYVSRGDAVPPLDGLVVRGPDGVGVRVGAKRRLSKLDALPFPERRAEPFRVLGVASTPIVGSRGCYADCSFCCIFSYAENAHGPRYRMRTPESIVAEMKREYEDRGIRIFVFHDDNFFLPYAPKNLERYRKLARLIDEAGLEDVGLVLKCRPNDVNEELFRVLQGIGLLRVYIGIETNSGEGIVSLNRHITSEDNRRALELFRAMGVYASFNVLIFDPEATLEGIETNLAFMEEFVDFPFNFCRTEVYAGTPLLDILKRDGRLEGDYLGYRYEMRDPRVELLFRIVATAFARRNFGLAGAHNLNMGLRLDHEIVRRFHPGAWDEAQQRALLALSTDVGLDSVTRVREALAFVRGVDPYDAPAVHTFTARYARDVARADHHFLARIKDARRAIEARVMAFRDWEDRTAEDLSTPSNARPWAAETHRLATSAGTELSTELLPAPTLRPAGGPWA